MMLKKYTALLLCLTMLFSFVACNKDTANNKNTEIYNPDSTQGTEAQTDTKIKISIPEGYTLLKLAWALEEKEICSSADFIEAAQSFDLSSYPILSDVNTAENVCFPLEGYLFPATYEFKKGTDPTEILKKLVSTFSAKFTEEMQAAAKAKGKTVHEILTIASIIEKEAFTAEQRTAISAVLYNRLSKNMKLQCDVTVKYCTGVIEVQYPDKIDFYKYHYNTYRCAALPAGPICNPGMESIRAALNPDANDNLYFVIDTEPPYESAFAPTYEEHLENCKRMGY